MEMNEAGHAIGIELPASVALTPYGMDNGFDERGRSPSPATATRRRNMKGERVYPLPIGRFPTAPRPVFDKIS